MVARDSNHECDPTSPHATQIKDTRDKTRSHRHASFLTERNGQQNQTLENRLRANFGIAKGVQTIPTGRYDSGGCLADTRTHRYVSDGPSAPALVTEKRYIQALVVVMVAMVAAVSAAAVVQEGLDW